MWLNISVIPKLHAFQTGAWSTMIPTWHSHPAMPIQVRFISIVLYTMLTVSKPLYMDELYHKEENYHC